MSREAIPGMTGISNRYGPRTLPDGKRGAFNTGGSAIIQIAIEATAADFTSNTGDAVIIPAGFKPLRVIVETTTGFGLSGTSTDSLAIGTSGSAATNGFLITDTNANTAGVYEITSFAGTWASVLSSATTVGFALEGDTAIGTATGKLRAVIEGYLA
jgi:hypothetical protein